MADKLYTTAEAAKYLGVTTGMLKHHYYKSKKLKGQIVGGYLIFTQADLDSFQQIEHRRGFATRTK